MARFAWGSATDVGRVRSNNQDSSYTSPVVFAVADGMGGHQGGEVASSVALDVLVEHYDDPGLDGLREAAESANDAVYRQASADPDLRGMGTTLVAIAPFDDERLGRQALAWVNIGDSRLYRLRDGELEQISEDHSLVEEMVRDGRISRDEAKTHPQRNILTRALGIDVIARIDVGTIDPFVGDRYLLCSDGLFNEVDEDRIAATLRRLSDPGEVASDLVRQALEGGGRDNITVVIVDVVDDDGAAATASRAIDTDSAEGHAEAPLHPKTEAVPLVEAKPGKAPRAKGPRRLTFRVVLFLVIVAGLLSLGYWAVYRSARDGYTVKQLPDSRIVIYEGSADRVLWFTPHTVEQTSPVTAYGAFALNLAKGVHKATLTEAQAVVTAATSTSTTSTTSTTTTTTTTPAAN